VSPMILQRAWKSTEGVVTSVGSGGSGVHFSLGAR
jgi:hypothetical protein